MKCWKKALGRKKMIHENTDLKRNEEHKEWRALEMVSTWFGLRCKSTTDKNIFKNLNLFKR